MQPLPRKIVLASSNAGKLREIARLLEKLEVEIVPQSDFAICDAEESGATFAENSLIKARHAALATGLPAIADDSGLSVDALDGRPGVMSARYSGPDSTDEKNTSKLLAELDGLPFLQFRITFVSNAETQLTPELSALGFAYSD